MSNILVVGDIMLDHYVVGNVERISPEAPIPILNIEKEYYNLGGCGNVALNLKSMGADVYCLTAFGDDPEGDKITELFSKHNIEYSAFISRSTIVKKRFISNHKYTHLLRVDNDYQIKINYNVYSNFYNKFDLIVVSDYAKGFIRIGVMNDLKSSNKLLIVDPKPINAPLYDSVFMITPNYIEYLKMMDFIKDIQNIIITMGNRGIEYHKGKLSHAIKSNNIEVVDVCGAGDTVTAVMAMCTAMGIDPLDAAKTALKCAEYVITQPGTVPVPKSIFEENLL